MTGKLIGRGWGFPVGTNHGGGIQMVSRDLEIEQAIHLILATAPGERPMRPDFGCAIHDYVFAPANESTAGRMAFEVKRALNRWEPRITVEAVDIHPGGDPTGSRLLIDISYSIKGMVDPRALVFPFYMIPVGEEQ